MPRAAASIPPRGTSSRGMVGSFACVGVAAAPAAAPASAASRRRRSVFIGSSSRDAADGARNMNELHQRPASARLLQRAPIGVVAQIAAGIVRQPRRNRARTRRAEQAGERRCAAQRDRPALRNHAALRTEAARVGKQERDGVARPRLDAEVAPAPGKAEHQDDVRPGFPEFCQVAIDGCESGREYVGRPHDFGEGRPPPAGE